jgi:hypothetical protein
MFLPEERDGAEGMAVDLDLDLVRNPRRDPLERHPQRRLAGRREIEVCQQEFLRHRIRGDDGSEEVLGLPVAGQRREEDGAVLPLDREREAGRRLRERAPG